jgi:hypothetical protein
VSTTGHGGEALPQETTPPEPKKVGFLNGVGAGLGDLVDDFWSFIPLTPSWSRNTVDMIDQMATAYQQGDIIDAFNVVNPLIPVANIALAVDNDDWYTVGQAAVGVGVAILSVVIAKKVPKIGKGAKTTRGPPRRKGPDYNWGDAKPHGGTVHNAAIDNDVARLRQDPAVSNIRKNQQQVDSNGNKVGTNRPDLQYDKNDCHTCVEYDHSARASAEHGRTIRRNDPNANVKLNKL